MKSRLKKMNKKGREKEFFLSLPQLISSLSFFSTLFSSPHHYCHFMQVMGKSLRRIELTLNRNLRDIGLMVC